VLKVPLNTNQPTNLEKVRKGRRERGGKRKVKGSEKGGMVDLPDSGS